MTIAPIVDTAPLGIGPQLGLVSIIGRNSVSTTDQSNAIISKGVQEFGTVADTHTTMFVVSNPFAAFQSFVLTGLLIFLKMGIQQIMKGNFNSFM
jgi:hypothetical protein